MKAFKASFCNLRLWVWLPCIFFCGTLFGLYVARQRDAVFPSILFAHNLAVENASNGKSEKISEKVNEPIQPKPTQPIRLVCMIVTMPANHDDKAMVVKKTWAPRCDVYYFVSSVNNKTLPSIAAVETEGRDKLWEKTKYGLRYALEHYGDYDFFLKADDDTYTIVDNLRKLVRDRDPNVPFIMGRRWRPYVKQGYLSGGGGYVMSRSAIKMIVDGLQNDPSCAGNDTGGAEDVRFGKCAEVVGVKLEDSLDDQGLERFHPFSAVGMINDVSPEYPNWYKSYNYHTIHTGYRCCSNNSITFHYVSPKDMYLYEFFLYRLRPATD